MPAATLADVADHVQHVRRTAGVDHVGLGSDFDGFSRETEGLEDVSCFPALLAELARRGWTEAELAKLAGGNVLRVLRAAEQAADRL
jgi:membrane dipeptidase